MDRNRGRVDRRGDGEVVMLGAGESYRPAGSSGRPRSPPRADTFRSRDRSPRRDRARSPPVTDSWHPGSRDRSPRRRSRTPPRRDRSPMRDNWRRDSRARSPRARTPPRRFSPRRDDRNARSPPRRDERRRSRSPYDRDRGTSRARSPISRRSPPAGPRGSFRPRSRSPDRRSIPTGPSTLRRRRSPSPARDSSGRTSGNTSRRSSPPVHSERTHIAQTVQRARSPPPRERSPVTLTYRDRDSARSTPRERSPVRPVAPKSPPRGPANFRPPPTGPSGGRNFTAPGPSTLSTVIPPSRPRQEITGPVVPPAGPRGYMGPIRGGHINSRGGRSSFGSDRVNRPDTSLWGGAPPNRAVLEPSTTSNTPVNRPALAPIPSIPSGPAAASIPTGPAAGIPTGPRAGVPSRPNLLHSSSVYGRSNITSAQAGPRPHPAMANLPQIIPGGRLDPTASGVSAEVAAGLKRKEEEEERLRAELHAKEVKLRVGLRQWGKLERDSKAMGLRSELSERHVRMLAGEGAGAAF